MPSNSPHRAIVRNWRHACRYARHPAWWRGNRLTILMYHSLYGESASRSVANGIAFGEQMRSLAADGSQVIHLEEAVRLVKARKQVGGKVVITFDDACRSFLTIAAPVLLECGFPATVFTVTGALRGGSATVRAPLSGRPMTAEDVSEVQALGFSLGSHTVTHSNLTHLDNGKLAGELREARDAILGLGERFVPFAYPFGAAGKRERDAAEAAGYDCALISGGSWVGGRRTDMYRLNRMPVSLHTHPTTLSYLVNPHGEWRYLRSLLRENGQTALTLP